MFYFSNGNSFSGSNGQSHVNGSSLDPIRPGNSWLFYGGPALGIQKFGNAL